MKTKRAVTFELNRLTDEQLIIIGHLTYHAGKFWNQANYLVQNRLAKPYYRDLYHKLKDADVNGARNILRKFKKDCFDLLTGLKRTVRIRFYRLKGSSEFLLYAGIGVGGRLNLPRGIRTVMSCQTPRGAPSYRAR